MQKEGDRARGLLLLTLAALAWSTGGLWVKMTTLHPMAVAGARSLIAGLLVLFYARPALNRITRAQVFGAFAYASCVVLFVVATRTTTAANAILLQYTAPVWVALLGPWLVRERTHAIDWVAIIAVLGGMVLTTMDNASGDKVGEAAFLGDLLAIASGLCFALCAISLRRERAGSPFTIVVLGNAIAALIGLPFLAAAPFVPADLLPLLPLGIVQLGLGYILYTRGVAHVSAVEATLIPVLEPLLNPLWVALGKGEVPSEKTIIGGAIILAAVTGRGLIVASQARKQKRSEVASTIAEP